MPQKASESLRVLLSYGDDYLRQRFNRQSLKSLIVKCPPDTEVVFLTDPIPEEILRHVVGYSLFRNFRIVMATFSAKLPDLVPMCEVLLRNAGSCSPLLLSTPDTRSGKSFVTKMEKAHGQGVIKYSGFNRCKDTKDARLFLKNECEARGMKLSSSALTLLSEMCLSDFGMLAAEIETLYLVGGERTLNEEDVLRYATPSAPNLNFLNVYMGVLKGDFMQISGALQDVGAEEFQSLTTVVLKILTAALGGKPPNVVFDVPAIRPQWAGDSKEKKKQQDKNLTPFVIKVGVAVSKRLRKQEIMSLFMDMYSAAHDYRRSSNKNRAIMTLRVTMRKLCGHDFRD